MQRTPLTEMQLRRARENMLEPIQNEENDMSENGDLKQEEQSQSPLENSGEQIEGLKKHWSTPTDVGELAAQANKVATMVLNHELPIDTARAYSAITKTVAQAKGLEVQRARYLNQEPSMKLADK